MLTLTRKPGEAIRLFDDRGRELARLEVVAVDRRTGGDGPVIRTASLKMRTFAAVSFDLDVKARDVDAPALAVSIGAPRHVKIWREELLDADGNPPA